MIKRIVRKTTFLGLVVVLSGQEPLLIPFDWSGQYGMMSVDGRLKWNADWMSGALFFDGTFCFYPLSFGDGFLNSVKYPSPTAFPVPKVIPDSAQVTNSFDYRRGDYLYDQLEVSANFSSSDRSVFWQGFKRTFAGTFADYLVPGAVITPNQQSYRLEYSSGKDQDTISAAIAHLITNSGIDSSASSKHQDRITVAGFDYSHGFGDWIARTYVSQFNQRYRLRTVSRPDFSTHYLNRSHLQLRLSNIADPDRKKHWGLITDRQTILKRHDELIVRNWSSIFAGLETAKLDLNLGLSFFGTQYWWPYANFDSRLNFGTWRLTALLDISAKPIHISKISNVQPTIMEKWYSGDFTALYQKNGFSTEFVLAGTIVDDYQETYDITAITSSIEFDPWLYSLTAKSRWNFYRTWSVAGNYRKSTVNNSIGDGIGDYLRFELTGSEYLFRENMKLDIRFWMEAMLNRDPHLGFDPYYGTPLIVNDPNYSLPGNWVANIEISAHISKVTLTWSVRNILNAMEKTVLDLYPDINRNYLWIKNSPYFHPLGQMVSFRVVWNFEN